MQKVACPLFYIKVIFEDNYIAVVDKPAGVPVYPIRPDEKGTMMDGLISRWPGSEPAHRLDNDTSGLLLVAKNKKIFNELRKQFDKEDILKQYTALVIGEAPYEGVIETPVIHDPKSKKRMKVVCRPCKSGDLENLHEVPAFAGMTKQNDGTQAAYTHYKLIKKYLGGRYSLLTVTIRTGVRHQIRVHMASIGHPLAGDRLYQNGRQRERDGTGLEHHFLHSSRIGLHHPKSGKWMEFSCPLATELENVLTKLS